MSNEFNGLRFSHFDADRFVKSPYKEMIAEHGQTGRDAIQVYELSKSMLMLKSSYFKTDELFLFDVAKQLGHSVRKMQSLLELAVEYNLFNKKLYKEAGIITSEAIQLEYFTVKQSYRYDIDTIPCAYMLLPSEMRQKLHIGLHYVVQKIAGKDEIIWQKETCRLFNQKAYKEILVDTGQERNIQLIIEKKKP